MATDSSPTSTASTQPTIKTSFTATPGMAARQERNPKLAVSDACRTDDVSRVKRVIYLSSLPGSQSPEQEILEWAVKKSIFRNAENILSYVLGLGAPVPTYSDLHVIDADEQPTLPSLAILSLLICHGWDINACPQGFMRTPFLWSASTDYDTTVWVLEQGARVHPDNQVPYVDNECLRDYNSCKPLLEYAICSDCEIRTFDLLRSRGAPLTRRVIHFAVERAAEATGGYKVKMMEFVRHLLDRYHLDVNAFDGPFGMGNHYGTPLCYVVHRAYSPNCKDVIELLLDRGADPGLSVPGSNGWSAMAYAKAYKSKECFLEVVAEWNRKNESVQEH